ncbi:MAG: carbonic anhydrase [Desulforhopalus sp.]|jgi:carbonic anhydrase
MKTRIVLTSVALVGILGSTLTFAAEKVHWGYTGETAPANWGKLAPEFSICASGKNQSPINLTGMVEGELPPLTVAYKVGGNEVVNNGHTIQVNYVPGSTISVNNATYELKQFHFHSPSENNIENTSYPMEAHFVHADKDGNLAVVAVMYETGKHNTELEKAWELMPVNTDGKQALMTEVDANVLLPANRDYYRFNGSLTTPPCSEGVKWFVLKTVDTASKEQIGKFAHTIHHDNNRPIQPVNARLIIQ